MAKKKEEGYCHICGKYGFLSKEHVPPQKAFNDRRTIKIQFEKALTLGPDEISEGPKQRGGIYMYTLCSQCNNDTGTWYGYRFVDWCYQGMDILIKSRGKPTLVYLNKLYPLSILKQIITMFFSLNTAEFRKPNQELVKFVLNRDMRHLPPKYRFFVYYNIEGRLRYVGFGGVYNIRTRRFTMIGEISYPPYGYVMTIDSEPPDKRLFEITHFADYLYNEFTIMELKLPVLPTHTPLPGDYRTRKEIEKRLQENR